MEYGILEGSEHKLSFIYIMSLGSSHGIYVSITPTTRTPGTIITNSPGSFYSMAKFIL